MYARQRLRPLRGMSWRPVPPPQLWTTTPQPRPRPHRGRRPPSKSPATNADDVDISPEARAAAQAVQAARLQSPGEDVRAERVAEAKRNLELGAHRVQEVVKLVAARMTKQLVL